MLSVNRTKKHIKTLLSLKLEFKLVLNDEATHTT